jgi:polyferredoxin
MKRQGIRKFILIMSMLLFPITIFYFSPYVIIMGALEGIMTGSFVVFILLLLSSMFFGRLFCGYLCPAGGIQECAMMVNEEAPKQGWRNYVKYITWFFWILGIVISFILSKKDITCDFFFLTDHGISVANIYNYIVYYGVVFLLFIPAVLFGKRVVCHYLCWMAPFMVLGSKISRILHLPQLHLKAEKEKCISCKICNRNCPMSLDVESFVQKEKPCSSECILCGACVDSCPKKVLQYTFKNR